MHKRKSNNLFVHAKSKLSAVDFKSKKVKRIFKKLEEENKQIREASKIDTGKLYVRFEF